MSVDCVGRVRRKTCRPKRCSKKLLVSTKLDVSSLEHPSARRGQGGLLRTTSSVSCETQLTFDSMAYFSHSTSQEKRERVALVSHLLYINFPVAQGLFWIVLLHFLMFGLDEK